MKNKRQHFENNTEKMYICFYNLRIQNILLVRLRLTSSATEDLNFLIDSVK